MRLFLGGGGNKKDSIELDKKFVASLDISKPILYIPIAINTDKYPYPTCLVWITYALKPYGVENIIMWTENELKNKTEKDFEQFGGVYIGGGNTFKLLKELKEFGTFEILKKMAQKDIPIYGGSAGAIIFAKTIIPSLSADQNNIGLTNFDGMNLVQGYDIWCHYKPVMKEEVEKYINIYRLKIIAVPENAGLYVTNDSILPVGPGSVSYF